jgi:isoleucyl-tRNA synthetase
VKALQALQKSHEGFNSTELRALAKTFAEKAIEEQKAGFKDWAVMGDWNNAYKTMNPKYELRQLEVFKAMVESGTNALNAISLLASEL